jgi:ubiquinone/menaquinone biosynthesis C-methylase UbiE
MDFAALARRYDAWYATPLGAWADRLEMEAIFRFLHLRPGERLLELGTGTGCYALAAARRGALVTAVDAEPVMLALARAKVTGHAAEQAVTLVQASMAALPFADASFDVVLAVTSLCFVADPLAVLREAARVLRPNGRLVLGELNRWSLWALVRRIEGRFHATTYRYAHFHSVRELCNLLAAAGLHTSRWEGLLHLPPIDHAGFLCTLDALERWGQRLTPALGAFLVLEATKEPRRLGQGGSDHGL